MKRALLFTLVLVFVGVEASAHDFWLKPSSATPTAGESMFFELFVGDHFKNEGPDRAYDAGRVDKLFVRSAKGEVDLSKTAVQSTRPYVRFTPRAAGGYLVALQRSPLRIELEAERFNTYLKKEGLPKMLKLRGSYNELDDLGREKYTRHMKTYVRAGKGKRAGKDKKKIWGAELGLDLEIVPEKDPTTVKSGGELPVRVLFKGSALEGATVSILSGDKETSAVTDAKGRVVLTVPADGPQIVRLIHMHRCRDCGTEEWRSYWASYWYDNAAR